MWYLSCRFQERDLINTLLELAFAFKNRGYEAMSHAAVCMHERGSHIGGSTYASALMMTNPTLNNRRNQLIDQPFLKRYKKEGPAKETAGSHLPVMPEKLICP